MSEENKPDTTAEDCKAVDPSHEVTPPEFMDWVRQWLTNPSRKRFTWVEIINIGLTAAIAVFAGYSAWVFQGQLQVMQQAATDTKQSSNQEIQNIRDQFRLDQRPYVWVSTPSQSVQATVLFEVVQTGPKGPKQIMITVHYTNFGKSPALKVISRRGMGVGPDARDKVQFNASRPEEGELVPPGKDDYFTVVSPPVKDSDVIQVAGGPVPLLLRDHNLAFAAHFYYFDSVGYKYQTDVCMQRLQTGAFQYCPTGNGIRDCAKEKCDL